MPSKDSPTHQVPAYTKKVRLLILANGSTLFLSGFNTLLLGNAHLLHASSMFALLRHKLNRIDYFFHDLRRGNVGNFLVDTLRDALLRDDLRCFHAFILDKDIGNCSTSCSWMHF